MQTDPEMISFSAALSMSELPSVQLNEPHVMHSGYQHFRIVHGGAQLAVPLRQSSRPSRPGQRLEVDYAAHADVFLMLVLLATSVDQCPTCISMQHVISVALATALPCEAVAFLVPQTR